MELNLVNLFQEYKEYAVLFSLLINIVIAVLGFLPSVFITGANLIFFGFWGGIIISFLGEALGAIIAFILYRKGFKKMSNKTLKKYPKITSIIDLEGKRAFYGVLSLRLMPFMPSGLVTIAGAVGKISLISFAISSSIGKIPALLIEGYSVYQVVSFTWEGKVILLLLSMMIIYWIIKSFSTSS